MITAVINFEGSLSWNCSVWTPIRRSILEHVTDRTSYGYKTTLAVMFR